MDLNNYLYYQDDYCNLYHGDCLNIMMLLINSDIKFDAIITDPPYGTTACKWDSIIPLDEMWTLLKQLRKPNTPIGLFSIQPFTTALIMSNIKEYKHEWIWNKEISGNFIQAKNTPLRTTESITYFGNNKINYYPQIEEADTKNIRPQKESEQKSDFLGKVSKGLFVPKSDKNKRYPKHLITFNARAKECNSLNRIHPTQKPIALLEYLIKTYTNERDVILDFACGSGTTLLASKNLRRKCYGIEIEEKYCEITKQRLMG
jgi:site-specific DNA-methyltransferase (adenine-specific)